jgi:glycosyltransferase involved in cell wall biosynthesis
VFIWGPIGGLESLTPDFIKNFSLKSRVIETTRRIIAKGISLSPGFKFRCKNADLILCKTKSTFDSIPEKYRDKAVIFTDVAANIGGLEPINDNYSNAELTFVSAGRLDGWRGFDIMIEAFAHALETEKNMKLHIMGDGTEKKRLKALINKLGIEDSVLLLGNVSTERYREEIANSDVVLNTCLKEGGVTTAFDCMTYGKPLICLDTGGYTDNFDDTCADIIPVNSREGTIKAIANSILSMRDSDKRRRYSYSMRQKGTQSDWEHKGVMINQMFMELISPPSNTLDL